MIWAEMTRTAASVNRWNSFSREIFRAKSSVTWAKQKNCKMDTGFDDPGIFFSDNFASEEQNNEDQINRQQVKKRFKDFIRQFHEGNFSYRYRCFFFLVRGSEKKNSARYHSFSLSLPLFSFLLPLLSPSYFFSSLNTFSPRSRTPAPTVNKGVYIWGTKENWHEIGGV